MTDFFRLFSIHSLVAMSMAAQVSSLVNRYDQFTTGSNTHETVLNSTNVNAAEFGKLFSYYVDGSVYAQPLYVSALNMPGHGVHNVLYVATMNDKVYAFDADRSGPPLWMRDFTDEMAGVTPVPITDITNDNDLNLVGNVGIESTPVIERFPGDSGAGAIYLVARTKEHGSYVQRVHKLGLTDGKNLAPPVVVEASVKGSAADAVDGMVRFDPRAGNQRPPLVLVNGTLVISWASHEDLRPYHGWIITYDAASLRQTGVFCVTPDTADGGIWQSGRGPAVDTSGGIYFETGNGGWDGKRNFGESVLKLKTGAGGLKVEDFYTPHNYDSLNERDADLGSTGPLLIPGTHLLICGNKEGAVFILDCDKLGGSTATDSGAVQTLALNGGRIMAGPAFWDGSSGPVLFLWSETDFPKAFRWTGHSLESAPFAKGTVASHGSPGGVLSVSSDGKKAGSGVLWATVSYGRSADHGNAPGVLHAFDAETLKELWNSEKRPERDRLGTLVKFVPPLVIGGKVFVPSYDNYVQVYGLLTSGGAGH